MPKIISSRPPPPHRPGHPARAEIAGSISGIGNITQSGHSLSAISSKTPVKRVTRGAPTSSPNITAFVAIGSTENDALYIGESLAALARGGVSPMRPCEARGSGRTHLATSGRRKAHSRRAFRRDDRADVNGGRLIICFGSSSSSRG